MTDERIVSYLKEWSSKGYSVDALKNELLKEGYSLAEIDEAILQAGLSVRSQQYNTENEELEYDGDRLKSLDITKGDFKEGIKPGVIAGVAAGAVVTVLGILFAVIVAFVLSMSGGNPNMVGIAIKSIISLSSVIGLLSDVCIGTIIGILIGMATIHLWEQLPGKNAFRKAFIFFAVITLLLYIMPPFILNELTMATAGKTIISLLLGSVVYGYIFSRLWKKISETAETNL
ncbi:MAG: hypothetical protein GXO64_04490 [Candidatus Micrarchaeota archaeon]|nr:hypothetical protein [Candidatus Micrarchaeota archaeon]